VINGQTGTDILSVSTASTFADLLFTGVSSVETLAITSNGATLTLGALAQAAGIVTVNASTTADTITATAYTVGLTVNAGSVASLDSIATGSGNDVFVFQSAAMSLGITLNGSTGTDTIRLDNGTFGTVTAVMSLGQMTNIEQIVVFDADGVTSGGVAGTAQAINLTLTGPGITTGAAGVTSISVDASAITDASDALLVTNNYLTLTSSVTFNMIGGAGNDSLAGGSGADTLSGGLGNDTLEGNAGNDLITGGSGADIITGGAGMDTLTGGSGNDNFYIAGGVTYATGSLADGKFTSDTITDLSAGDVINFTSGGVTNAAMSFTSVAISLSTAASFNDYLDTAAAANSAALTISWFQFGGNTYVVQNNMSAATFVSGNDVVVGITGLVNLQNSTLASTATVGSLTIV
jgi:S-layer protein